MATTIDPRVIAELALILEGINPFPNPNEFNFDTCRGFKKDSTSRCGNSPGTAEEQKKLIALLSEFQVMTKCVDTDSLYDKMESLISLTHCRRRHREDACEAFDKWKAERKAAASDPPPVTPSRSAISRADSLESLSDASGMKLPRSVVDSPGYDNRGSKTDYRSSDEVGAQTQKFKRIGDVHFPETGKEQDDVEIYKTIRNPPSATRMFDGILYVLEHTEISDLFNIGWTSRSEYLKIKQSRNCYTETNIIYETEGGAFIGAFQAERIAHAILAHKRVDIHDCPHCQKHHTAWFLVSKQEAYSVVKLAERWLKIPAYSLQQENYKLTPKGDSILKIMLPFSINKMNMLIDKVGKSDNNLSAFSDITSSAVDRETSTINVSSVATEKETPRFLVDKNHVITPSLSYTLREKSPVGGASSKGTTHLAETEEIFEIRSRETTLNGNSSSSNSGRTLYRRKYIEPILNIIQGPNNSKGKESGNR